MMRKVPACIVLVVVGALIAAACTPVGYDAGMGHRCVFSDSFSYTPDCPGATRDGTPHWEFWAGGGGSRTIGLIDTSVPYSVNPNAHLQTAWIPPGSNSAIHGWTVETQIRPGVVPGSAPAHEVNLAIHSGISGPLHGLHSIHTIKMSAHSGQYDAEYGIWFTNPANNQVYILNLVLPPSNPNTSVDAKVIFHGCAWHCGQPDHNNVIKLNAKTLLGVPSIMDSYVTVQIDWEQLLNYVHSRGWWTEISPSINVWREWFQLQSWATDNTSAAGSVDTFQGNWMTYYP